MKLLDLHIDGFGKFHHRDLSLEDGLNMIYGRNEAGKSTLHTFIRSMLFGLERGRGRASRNDCYSRCIPWEGQGAYGGRMRVEHEGTVYRIERNFSREQKSLTIVDETLGREVVPAKAFLDEMLCGLTETSYSNTISIGQLKSATDGGMVSELRNFIANMNTSGNMALNITRASSYLKNRRKEFERRLVPEAARSYTSLLGEIRAIEKEISAPEYENQLKAYQDTRTQVHTRLAEKQRDRESLLQKIATGRQALDSAQFSDEASILRYQDETLATYGEYQDARMSSERKFRPVLAGLCLLLALVCGGLGGIFFARSQMMLLTELLNGPEIFSGSSGVALAAGSWAGGILFLVLGISLILKGKGLKKEAAMTGKVLQEIFSRHLGDSAVSEEALRAFQARMEEYLRLSRMLVESEAAVVRLEGEAAALKEQEDACGDAISRQQRMQWELEKKLDHLTHCKDQVESLKRVLAENDRVREEIAAIDLALETITELSSSIRDSFGLYLNKTASDMIAGITDGVYSSMSVDENLNVFMNTRTRLVPIDQVSSGTMDQVYLALRLAAARLFQGDEDKLPLILDDSFVLYDEDRLRSALRWLCGNYKGQILMFTCHQREARVLEDSGIQHHLIRL